MSIAKSALRTSASWASPQLQLQSWPQVTGLSAALGPSCSCVPSLLLSWALHGETTLLAAGPGPPPSLPALESEGHWSRQDSRGRSRGLPGGTPPPSHRLDLMPGSMYLQVEGKKQNRTGKVIPAPPPSLKRIVFSESRKQRASFRNGLDSLSCLGRGGPRTPSFP